MMIYLNRMEILTQYLILINQLQILIQYFINKILISHAPSFYARALHLPPGSEIGSEISILKHSLYHQAVKLEVKYLYSNIHSTTRQ